MAYHLNALVSGMAVYLAGFTCLFYQFNLFSRIREQGRSSQSKQLHVFYVQSKNGLLDDEVAIYKNVTPGSGPVSSKTDLFPSG